MIVPFNFPLQLGDLSVFLNQCIDVTVSSNSSQPPLEYHSLLGSAQTVGSFLVPPTRKGSSNLFIKVSLISSAVTIRLKTDSFTNRASRKATIFVGDFRAAIVIRNGDGAVLVDRLENCRQLIGRVRTHL